MAHTMPPSKSSDQVAKRAAIREQALKDAGIGEETVNYRPGSRENARYTGDLRTPTTPRRSTEGDPGGWG